MGIYIRGMEMPKACMECPIETDYGTCGYYSLYVEAGHESDCEKRRDDCPLIEIQSHGDLIDRDELLSQYGGPIWTAKTDYAEGLRDVVADIKCAAAIIEAEPCNDLAKPNNTIFAVQNTDEDEWLFAAKPIDYMHTPSVEEIIEADGE